MDDEENATAKELILELMRAACTARDDDQRMRISRALLAC